MNGEGSVGRLNERYDFLQRSFDIGADFGIDYYPDISLGFFPSLPQAFFELPPVLYGPTESSDGPEDSATPGDETVSPYVVDPELGTTTTVFENPGAPTATRTRETDWDWVYDRYVVLNEPEIEVEVPVHHEIIDWGVEVIGGIAGGILDPVGIGAAISDRWLGGSATTPGVTGYPSLGQQTSLRPAPTIAPGGTVEHGCPPYGPKYAKICLATNVITPLRRRRRRRLLTSSDIKDLSALKSIVGGAALQAAVTQAVRR